MKAKKSLFQSQPWILKYERFSNIKEKEKCMIYSFLSTHKLLFQCMAATVWLRFNCIRGQAYFFYRETFFSLNQLKIKASTC